MHSFHDTQNRTWQLVLNIGAAMRVRDALAVDLLMLEMENLSRRIMVDDLLTAQIVGAIIRPALDDAGVSLDAFYGALEGAALAEARKALVAELKDFFRGGGRSDRVTLLEVEEELTAAYWAQAEKAYRQDAAAKTSGGLFGTPPAASESTPGPSPTASST